MRKLATVWHVRHRRALVYVTLDVWYEVEHMAEALRNFEESAKDCNSK
jgi:hypothetical protein